MVLSRKNARRVFFRDKIMVSSRNILHHCVVTRVSRDTWVNLGVKFVTIWIQNRYKYHVCQSKRLTRTQFRAISGDNTSLAGFDNIAVLGNGCPHAPQILYYPLLAQLYNLTKRSHKTASSTWKGYSVINSVWRTGTFWKCYVLASFTAPWTLGRFCKLQSG